MIKFVLASLLTGACLFGYAYNISAAHSSSVGSTIEKQDREVKSPKPVSARRSLGLCCFFGEKSALLTPCPHFYSLQFNRKLGSSLISMMYFEDEERRMRKRTIFRTGGQRCQPAQKFWRPFILHNSTCLLFFRH